MAPHKTPRQSSGPGRDRTLRGPILARDRNGFDPSTYDQRLLEMGRADHDWKHADPWRVMRITSEFIAGFDALHDLDWAVTVFGSARLGEGTPEYEQARQLGAALVEAGYAVITGGGPGLMEGPNRGAHEVGGTSVGLGIELPFEQGLNEWVDLGLNFRYFFARKTMFLKYSQAFISLPGGYGTMDEVFEILCMVQTGKVTNFPIVLLGTEYWGGLVDWIREQLLGRGLISDGDDQLFLVTDSVDESVEYIVQAHSTMTDPRNIQ
ncbi:LOG family protein [Corynebacterium tuscaniense]|uniref:LOG family protein n=1 Tax=Corynebacterium tuscaniense TaxID=302449 RepID=UPI00050FBE82|nr:TIGR00730 family Rossman fold protein [Corynebacterium tuscaniense]KGF24374.1 DNA-binding protein [Corynebacterium tuscaniense DNF00037]